MGNVPPDTVLGLILQGGAVGVLLLVVWWSRDGTIRWGKAHAEQILFLEAQLAQTRSDSAVERARLEKRNDELWELLKEATLTIRASTHAAGRAATLAESALHGREGGSG